MRWFYQYVVWNDFVKRLTNAEVRSSVLIKKNGKLEYNGNHYKLSDPPVIPVEFAVSAYRFGHSLIRPGYQVNNNKDVGLGVGVELPIFDPKAFGQHDLSGFRFFPHRHTVQWDWYFKMQSSSGPFPQPARRIDPKLSSAVSAIPDGRGGTNPLASLNLLRSWRMGVPSGSAVAKKMGFDPHLIDDPHEDILWHYILKEAEILSGGNSGLMLGNVGSTIVAQVLGGLLTSDPQGYVRKCPDWTPDAESAITALMRDGNPENDNGWEVADMIRASGMPVDANDVENTIAKGKN